MKPTALILVTLALMAMSRPVHAHEIDPCYCDQACYTDQVTELSCRRDRAELRSKGLPGHEVMTGIKATNQQFPAEHDYRFEINTAPRFLNRAQPLDPGPIGVAVNGIPLFSSYTQGPTDPATGKPPSAYQAGELDACGGHAGRGDDYHYHIAPKCLIEDLGPVRVEKQKRPIGFAMDGFPILALGWFEPANDVEAMLDPCRGMQDDKGQYFYNVMHDPDWDILNCLQGEARGFARDQWRHRTDRTGQEITGLPIGFRIKNAKSQSFGGDVCHVMTGVLGREQLLNSNGTTSERRDQPGSLFHCNSQCYGLFFEADRKPQFRGRVIYYDLITTGCPGGFDPKKLTLFDGYEGPPQSRKGPPPPGGGRPPKGPRKN